MANNRMFLFHRPTGKCVEMGRCYSTGWVANAPEVVEFFAMLEDIWTEPQWRDAKGYLEDFVLLMEHASDCPGISTAWHWTDGNGPDNPPRIVLGPRPDYPCSPPPEYPPDIDR